MTNSGEHMTALDLVIDQGRPKGVPLLHHINLKTTRNEPHDPYMDR